MYSYSPIAHLAERLTVNQKVAGSNPAGGAEGSLTMDWNVVLIATRIVPRNCRL